MNNKRDNQFQLQIKPLIDRIVFASKKLGKQQVKVQIKLTNPTFYTVAFKIKSTSNVMFRVRPVYGLLKSNESMFVLLIFKNILFVPPNDLHYFAIYTIIVNNKTKDANEIWDEYKGDPSGIKILPIDFEENDPKIVKINWETVDNEQPMAEMEDNTEDTKKQLEKKKSDIFEEMDTNRDTQ
ncbi:Major sperm protein [Aphelenchoides besseyi]|nr:Major sperm protein [Aphelenchoides besseyi]KAI6211187.1 Major sperm protein [Aphelenchoides besseyi]